MASIGETRSLSDMLSATMTQVSQLMQTEIELARAEIGQKVNAAGLGIGLIGAAAVIAIPGLVLLLMALAALLVHAGLAVDVADAIAGGVGLVISILFLAIGMSRLRPEVLTPQRTIKQLQRDVIAAKGHLT